MIVRRYPNREMKSIHNTIDRMFDEAWRPFYDNTLALDITESDSAYTVETAIPGVNPDDIEIRVENNVLTISAETAHESNEEDENNRVIMRERRYGKFSRSVRLGNGVDVESVQADYHNGILTLTLPKREEVTPRRIPVNANA
jgi:HSP20 family protein